MAQKCNYGARTRYNLACRAGPNWTEPHSNRIPVIVLCAHAKPKTLISYWSTSMDNVKIELLTTNNNKGF